MGPGHMTVWIVFHNIRFHTTRRVDWTQTGSFSSSISRRTSNYYRGGRPLESLGNQHYLLVIEVDAEAAQYSLF